MKPRIHYTKPSNTGLEIRYATDAATRTAMMAGVRAQPLDTPPCA